jgi:hypothetical protein
MAVSDWADVAVTAGLGAAGLAVANSLRLRRRAERESTAIERRWDAYQGLWKASMDAAPMRREPGAVLSEQDRAKLYDELTTWFFEEGGGMILGEPARSLYLTAKQNLVCADEALTPRSAAEYVLAASDREKARSKIATRQLSLVRTAMRADLGIMGRPYGGGLSERDRDFLRSQGVHLWERPWWNGSKREWLRERIAGARQIETSDPLLDD